VSARPGKDRCSSRARFSAWRRVGKRMVVYYKGLPGRGVTKHYHRAWGSALQDAAGRLPARAALGSGDTEIEFTSAHITGAAGKLSKVTRPFRRYYFPRCEALSGERSETRVGIPELTPCQEKNILSEESSRDVGRCEARCGKSTARFLTRPSPSGEDVVHAPTNPQRLGLRKPGCGFPLPEGEGRGEGEQADNPTRVTVPGLSIMDVCALSSSAPTSSSPT